MHQFKGIVYQVTNIMNNKIYIGQTTANFEKYIKSQMNSALKKDSKRIFWRAIKKYGIENFIWEQIVTCYSREELDIKEEEYIWLNNSNDKNYGYNIRPGGKSTSGWHHYPETIEKFKHPKSESHKKNISKATKGKPKSVEFILHMSLSRKGKPASEKHNKNVSLAKKGKPNLYAQNAKWIYKNNENKFIPKEQVDSYLEQGWSLGRSKITNEKNSKSNKGRVPWNKNKKGTGFGAPGRIPWNKGLTKETDERVKNNYTNQGKNNALSIN
jgi:group I intron endonuclease